MQPAARMALTYWIVATLLLVVALYVFLGPPGSSEGAGEAIGRLTANTGMGALIAWWLARRKDPRWSWLRFGVVFVLAVLAFAAVAAIGRARAEMPRPIDAVAVAPATVAQDESGVRDC